MNEANHPVLLKDGRLLHATTDQIVKINTLILARTDFQERKVKLNGIEFKLGDIETDLEKISQVNQGKLDLGDIPPKPRKNMA